jgi:cytochrome c
MNKIIVSVILIILLILGINKIADIIFYVEKPEKSIHQVEGVTTKATTKIVSTNSDDELENIMTLLTAVNTSDGEKIFKKCASCHSITKGGGNKIGPALWGILGRQVGSTPNYKYSKVMAAYGKTWSFKEMDGFIKKPKDWIKGTKMSFAGLKNAKERAALILYMNNNTDIPLPLQ